MAAVVTVMLAVVARSTIVTDAWSNGGIKLPQTPQEMIPFAVVGSDQEYQVNGRRLLGRKTKWGTIEGKHTFHFTFHLTLFC